MDVEILRAYQSWRRGEDERTMEELGIRPKTIGAAIDWAIAELENRRQAVPDGWRMIDEVTFGSVQSALQSIAMASDNGHCIPGISEIAQGALDTLKAARQPPSGGEG